MAAAPAPLEPLSEPTGSAVKRTFMTMGKLFRSGVLAGFCIGLGCVANMRLGGIPGAVLFTFGLLTVVHFQYKLYTGTAGFVSSGRDMGELAVILAANLVGTFLLAAAIAYCLSFEYALDPRSILASRMNYGLLQALLMSAFCGYIMTVCVKFGREGRFLPLLFGVPIFILSGYLHCIADAFYLFMSVFGGYFEAGFVPYYAAIVAGNFLGCNLWRVAE